MKLSNKVLWLLSGIIGSIFFIIVVSLALAKKIKVSSLIILTFVIILSVVMIDLAFYLIRKQKKISVERGDRQYTSIDLCAAREISASLIKSQQYSEYEEECLQEDIWHMGESKTPVYSKLIRGMFDKKLIGILVNMENAKKMSSKEYSESEYTKEQIMADMTTRANLLAVSPKPTPNFEEEVVERSDGTRTTRKRAISSDNKKPQGDLQ